MSKFSTTSSTTFFTTLRLVTFFALIFALIIAVGCSTARAERRQLLERMVHLRSGEEREWTSFPERAEGNSHRLTFAAKSNKREATLSVRRVDVKHGWHVKLNGKRLGALFSDENDAIETWRLKPGTILTGENVLEMEATGERVDDVRLGDVWLDDRPFDEVYGECQVEITVKDNQGEPLPCRLTIVNRDGTLVPLGAQSSDRYAVRSGMLYTGDGRAKFGLQAGEYTVHVTRGAEYGLAKIAVLAKLGETFRREVVLPREVDTTGWVSSDTHVHTFTYSRHGDVTIDERMLTIAGEGLELPIATDHNLHIDYEAPARRLGMRKYFTPIVGNEVTTKLGHFNVFPIVGDVDPPDHTAMAWPRIFDNIFKTPQVRIVILNHPRDVHAGYLPFAPKHFNPVAGAQLDKWNLRANAMEVVNSAAQQSDPMLLVSDWMAWLNAGKRIVPIGSSDSHEVARKLVGQGRTYVRCDDADPGAIDVEAAVRSFVDGKVIVSLGLFANIKVNGKAGPGDQVSPEKDDVIVEGEVQGPGWAKATRLSLFLNGERIRTFDVLDDQQSRAGVKARVRWVIPRPLHDGHLSVVAEGPGNTGPHFVIAKAYQPRSKTWRPFLLSVTGAVWLDADRDGRWSSPRQTAARLLNSHRNDRKRLLQELARHDVAVVGQAAHLLAEGGVTLLDEQLSALVGESQPVVKKGFEAYFAAWRISQQARAQ